MPETLRRTMFDYRPQLSLISKELDFLKVSSRMRTLSSGERSQSEPKASENIHYFVRDFEIAREESFNPHALWFSALFPSALAFSSCKAM